MKQPGTRRRRHLAAAGAVLAGLLAASCGGGTAPATPATPSVPPGPTASATAGAFEAATATSAADFGGMGALVAAAQEEGTLNVIALRPEWANYREVIAGFEQKYGITVKSSNPDDSSEDELVAIRQLRGQSRAPDVIDVDTSSAVRAAREGLLAPYRVTTWDDIDKALKEPTGLWYGDYGGYVSIGYDANAVAHPPTSFADLTRPEYRGQVAINGDPTQSGAAFAAVYAAALANGGSLGDITPGIAYFADLRRIGNLVAAKGTPATVESGETPIVIWWDYLNASIAQKQTAEVDFQVVIPTDASYAAYYDQAISATAPHPAAARLWQEYLYSDEGQNLWLKGLVRPVRLAAMTAAGTADVALLAKLPAAPAKTAYPSRYQLDAASRALAENWAEQLGGA